MLEALGPSTPSPVNDTTDAQRSPAAAIRSADRVDEAVAEIRSKLKDGGIFEDDVTHDELKDIAALFKNLSPAEANAVMAKLTPAEVNKIADEMDSSGIGNFGGLSADQKRDFIGDLAGKLDAAQFEKLTKAFDDPQELADIVAAKGSNDAKIGFINAYKGDASDGVQSPSVLDSLSGITHYGNEAARAVGTVLGSMDARGIERAIGHTDAKTGELTGGALSSEQLRTVMKACIEETSYTGGPMGGGALPSYGFQPDKLNKILDAAARSGDAGLKAEVFQAAAPALEAMQSVGGLLTPAINAHASASSVSDHMAALLRTDTRGIVHRLEDADATGGSLKPFTRQLLADGKTEDLKNMLLELHNGPTGDSSAYLKDSQHAQELGYFIGAVAVGLQSLEKSKKDEAALVGELINSAVGNLPYGGDALTNVSQHVLDETLGKVEKGTLDAPRAFYELLSKGLNADEQTVVDAAVGRVIDWQGE